MSERYVNTAEWKLGKRGSAGGLCFTMCLQIIELLLWQGVQVRENQAEKKWNEWSFEWLLEKLLLRNKQDEPR